MIEAILFDFDGTLADTMQDHFNAWQKAFLDFNLEIKGEDYYPIEGVRVSEVAKIISEKYSLNIKLEDITNLKHKYYLANHKFLFYPEIPEIIEYVKDKFKIAIVSAATRERLEKTVSKEFLDEFDVIIAGEDTKKGKPSPEPYQKAMEKLKVDPEGCIVIENAPLGIKSGKASGAYCIALTTTLDKKYLLEADVILNSHRELLDYLKSI